MYKKTCLNEAHKRLGARMVEFGGWEMPVQYTGVIEEHLAVRNAAGLFDVSHMGEIAVRGAEALDFIQHLTINDASVMVDGQVQYSALCYPNGGVVDDVTLYRFGPQDYLFCVNAANTDKDYAWMEEVLEDSDFDEVMLENVSRDFAQLALQGPASSRILQRLTDGDLSRIAYYYFAELPVNGRKTIVSRTGYTGEDGFELYLNPLEAEPLWDALMEAGADDGLLPAGLGARDTLRLEMRYALYGHELSPEITPLEAGLGWITKLGKQEFIGRDALLHQKEKGIPRKLVAFTMSEAGIPRADYPVFVDDRQVGVVTSGTMSPVLRVGIGLALIESEHAAIGNDIAVGVRKRQIDAKIIKPPFIQK